MLENILGLSVLAWFTIGIVLAIIGVWMVMRAGGYCVRELKIVMEGGWEKRTGKCIRSIRDLGIFGAIFLVYLLYLFVMSLFVIIYALQYGWTSVYTIDLALCSAYIIIIVLLALGRKL